MQIIKNQLIFFKKLLKKYDVEDALISKEKRIFDGTYTSQDAIDMDWAYETFWSIFWALGFVDDISDASELCDSLQAIQLIAKNASVDDLKSKSKLRDVEEILDMLDLYYRYHWAVVNKLFIDENTNIGNLIPSNVIERRRGLEWLISSEEDWYNISLDT